MNMFPNANQPIIPQGISHSLNANSSYAHSVLQSLCFLQASNKIFDTINSMNMRHNPSYPLINELLNIITCVKSGKVANSQNLLYYYFNKYRQNQNSINNSNALSNDPFQFFYFLLQFLHSEINMPNYYYTDYLIQYHSIQMNDDNIYSLYMKFICNNQNSIITNTFFNIMKYTHKCQNCGIYYSYGFQHILKFNVDLYTYFRNKFFPNKHGTNLTLDDIFKCYCGGNTITCKYCGNKKALRYTKISLVADVIIIYLDRKNHVYKSDINYPFQFDIKEYMSRKNSDNLSNIIYDLKAVISYTDYGNIGRYFVDCKVPKSLFNNVNINQDVWIRYLNSDICILDNINRIYQYEPKILVYEIAEIKKFELNNAQNPNININLEKSNFFDEYNSPNNFIGMNNNFNNSKDNINIYNNSNNNNKKMGFKMNSIENNNVNLQIIGKKKSPIEFDINDYFLKMNLLNLYSGMDDLMKRYLNKNEYNSNDFTYFFNSLKLNPNTNLNGYFPNVIYNKNENDYIDYIHFSPNSKIIQQINEFNKTNIDKKIDIKKSKNKNNDIKLEQNKNLLKMYESEKFNNDNNENGMYI